MKTKFVILLACVLFGVVSAGTKAAKDAELLDSTAEKDGDLKTASSYGYGYAVGYPSYYGSYYPYSYGYGNHFGGYYPYWGGYSHGYGWPGGYFWK